MKNEIILSVLGHTWLIDLDGTLVKHNGYKMDGEDTFLPGAREFLSSISKKDTIVFLTSRTEEYKKITIDFLQSNKVIYDHIIFNLPYGERIVINDDKPSGLCMCHALQTKRDEFFRLTVSENDNL